MATSAIFYIASRAFDSKSTPKCLYIMVEGGTPLFYWILVGKYPAVSRLQISVEAVHTTLTCAFYFIFNSLIYPLFIYFLFQFLRPKTAFQLHVCSTRTDVN